MVHRLWQWEVVVPDSEHDSVARNFEPTSSATTGCSMLSFLRTSIQITRITVCLICHLNGNVERICK